MLDTRKASTFIAAFLPPSVKRNSQLFLIQYNQQAKDSLLTPIQSGSVHQRRAKDRDQTDHKAGGGGVGGGSKQE